MLNTQHDAFSVDGERFVESGPVHVLDHHPKPPDSGVVDHDVKTAIGGIAGVHEGPNLGLVGDVGDMGEAADLAGHARDGLAPASGDHDPGAGGGETAGYGLADAAAATGDHRNPCRRAPPPFPALIPRISDNDP